MIAFCQPFESPLDMNPKQKLSIECSFCSSAIETKIGKVKCPECHTRFEIDDRMECVFVDNSDLRLPIHGTVCPQCGLLQHEDVQRCLFWGQRLIGTMQ